MALNSLAEERSEEAGNHLANIKEVRNLEHSIFRDMNSDTYRWTT
jgi:hypothetical protein